MDFLREPVIGHTENLKSAKLCNIAVYKELLGVVVGVLPFVGVAEKLNVGVSNSNVSVRYGDKFVVAMGLKGKKRLNENVAGCRGGKLNGFACAGCPFLKDIFIAVRHKLLSYLFAHNASGFFHHLLVGVVAFVNGNVKGLVLGKRKLLNCVLKLFHIAVAASGCACSVVIVKGLGDDARKYKGFYACKFKFTFRSALEKALVGVCFNDFSCVFGMKIDRP